MNDIEMTLLHGFAWREKMADEILAKWHSLSVWKRAYWTLRGKAPGTREQLIASF